MPDDDLEVRVEQTTVLRELPVGRKPTDHVALLDAMGVDDLAGMSDDEVREMCFMSLQDLAPDDAARVVLTHDLSGVLKPGQIDNLAEQMDTEKVWEEYPQMALHERLFHTASLLWAAVPRVFPQPDAIRVRLAVTARSDEARACLQDPAEAFVVRLLAAGMEPRALIHRLFEDALAGDRFPEAPMIAWTVTCESVDADTVTLEVIGSCYWLGPLSEAEPWTSRARPDRDEPDDDDDDD